MMTTAQGPRPAQGARPNNAPLKPATGGMLKSKAGAFYKPKPISKAQKNANILGSVIRGSK